MYVGCSLLCVDAACRSLLVCCSCVVCVVCCVFFVVGWLLFAVRCLSSVVCFDLLRVAN